MEDRQHINDLWEDMDRLNALYEEAMWDHDSVLEFVADYKKIESLLKDTHDNARSDNQRVSVTDFSKDLKNMSNNRSTYTKEEVDNLIAEALAEAKRIDESMRKHNRDATVISMILGFTALALFVDGLLRLLSIIPPFMGIDIDLLDKIVEKVEVDVIDKIRQVPLQNFLGR